MSGNGYPIGEWSSCWSHVGSIILHTDSLPDNMITHNFYSFRFLKVLDLKVTNISSFPANLIYLRYFAAKVYGLAILSNMTNCWNLETLLIKSDRSTDDLSGALLEMSKLRHLHISSFIFKIENEKGIVENSKKLYNLRTLSNPTFPCIRDAELLLSKTPNLHELRCKVEGINNFRGDVLKFPIRLETLKIVKPPIIYGFLPFFISAPNLKKLTLIFFSLDPQHLSEIGLLQNLQVLKLGGLRNKGWKVRNDEFPKLKVLKLQHCYSLEEWTVEDDAFPNLEHLVLRSCNSLKEIPSWFREISSLKSIEVDNCDECVGKSARDIMETQVEDYQNVGFEVFISKERK